MKVVKISDNVYNILYDLASKRQTSVNQLLQDILNVYLGGSSDKVIKQIIDKDITLLYDDTCDKCGKPLKVGDKAHFTKYVYEDGTSKSLLLCPDCYINSDPLLYRKYMRIREYEVIQKQLKQEIDRLIQELKKTEMEVSISSVKREIINLWKDVSFYIKDVDKDVNRYEELMSRLEELANKVSALELSIKTYVKPKEKYKEKYKDFLR